MTFQNTAAKVAPRRSIFRNLCITVLTAGVLALSSTMAVAADPTTPCDPQFMQAMEARAWLEAQREITQNENLIVKPDSVLEYSCFSGFLNKAASNYTVNGVNRPFSETDAWQTIGFSTTSTDSSLTKVVGSALATYLNGNFPNAKFLGGRLDVTGNPEDRNGNVNGATDYSCQVMARVWEQARCQNFDSIADQDGFRDFLWYANQANDPRKGFGDNANTSIKACSALTSKGGGKMGTGYAINNPLGDAYQLALKEAYNGEQNMFVLPAADDKDPDNQKYDTDAVQSYFNLILPDSCSDAIPTGVKIYRSSTAGGGAAGGALPDGICPNPGCSYSVTGTTLGKCE